MKYPNKFKELIDDFGSLPGVGPKTAERLAFFCIDIKNQDKTKKLAKCLDEAVDVIKECKTCGMIADSDLCEICQDDTRDNRLMVLENAKDVIAFEKTKAYKGRYHVLNGAISPTNGIGPDDIGIDKLIARVKNEVFDEIIIATSSNIDGELTALYLNKKLEECNLKAYRIGYGLPASTNIEYVDEVTLIKSLESKKEM